MSDLCEVIAAVFLMVFLLVLLLARKNNILKIYFGDLPVFQYIVFCMVLFGANLLESDVRMEYPDAKLLKVLAVGNVAMVCIMMIQMILVRESDTRKEKVIDVLDEQMKKVTDYYYAMTEQEEQTRKFRHDIKNLLFALHSMVEQEENDKAMEYIEEMNGLCQRTTQKYDTGNFIADALLSAKSSVAANSNTEIRFDGFIPSEGIENVDMVILLSNIVDNAVEACEKISGQKTISIESVLQKQMWILSVKNPVETDVKIQKNRIETTKRNKQLHGYGIQNMQRVVKKHDGNLKFTCKDGVFSVRVMLQLKK
ncbi:MAG: sensor histidine kinase [Lachnospiraceae bacterium]